MDDVVNFLDWCYNLMSTALCIVAAAAFPNPARENYGHSTPQLNTASSRLAFIDNVAPPLYTSQKRSNSDVAPLPLHSPGLTVGLGGIREKFLQLLLASATRVSI